MDLADLVQARPVKLLRQPIFHFLLMGGLLYALAPNPVTPDSRAPDTEAIQVSPADVQRLREQWTRESARAPTRTELTASIAQHVDEEILVHEALQLGLDERDPVVRERLLLNLRFAYPQRRLSDAALLREARALGMARRDPVLRRRLAQIMEQNIVSRSTVSEADLRAYAARYPQRFGARTRTSFRQVFLSRDRPRADARAEAARWLAQLRKTAGAAPALGDPFLLGQQFQSLSQDEIARQLGADFAAALAQVRPGEWTGPLPSLYGLHLVRVEHVEQAAALDFAAQRAQLAYAVQQEVEARTLRAELARLRGRYRVEPLASVAGTL